MFNPFATTTSVTMPGEITHNPSDPPSSSSSFFQEMILKERRIRLCKDIQPIYLHRDHFVDFFKRVLVNKTIGDYFKDLRIDAEDIDSMFAFVDKHDKIQEVERLIKECFEEIPKQIQEEFGPLEMIKEKIPAPSVSSLFHFLVRKSQFFF